MSWSRQFARAMLGCAVLLAVPAAGEERRDSERELQLILKGERVARHIAGAEYRIAVFTFEDPHATGLGDAIAGLLARRILTESRVGSIGVIRYEGNLTPSGPGELGYFDKVDLIATEQEVSLAVWGMVRAYKDRLRIDTYLQLPEDRLEAHYRWTLKLPERMGAGELTARLRPDRIAVQQLDLPAVSAGNIRTAVSTVNQIRSGPSLEAEIIAELPQAQVYRVLDRAGDWIKVSTGPLTGWVAAGGSCDGECGRLLLAADFASLLLRYMAFDEIEDPDPALTEDAVAVVDQIRALDGLGATRPDEIWDRSMRRAARWTEDGDMGPGGVPPGGAAFANIMALADLTIQLHVRFSEASFEPEFSPELLYDQIVLDHGRVAEVAFRLAEASLIDPKNQDVLHNLSVLFDVIGDERRAARAAQLEEQAAR